MCVCSTNFLLHHNLECVGPAIGSISSVTQIRSALTMTTVRPSGFTEGKWKYRDYVVQSLNDDKPYDQFIREQIAGDELVDWRNAVSYTPEIREHLIATGYLRCAEDVSGEDPRPAVIWSILHETVAQVGTSLLGLSLKCAQCHDHKYEPIPQEDYSTKHSSSGRANLAGCQPRSESRGVVTIPMGLRRS